MKPKFQFSNVVVVNGENIGVIVKSWGPSMMTGKFSYEIYVRSENKILEYGEEEINHYVFSKDLDEDEKDFY